MGHIFISYSHEDSDFAEVLINKIEREGLSIWADTDRLNAGEDWRSKIDQAIKEASLLIVIMSPSAKASEYVTYEWAFAWGAGVKVIPVLFKPTELHPRLETLQYLDFSNRSFRPWDKLIKVVKSKAEGYATNDKEREFKSYFSERPDVITEVEKEAGSSSEELKMKVAKLIVRLEVNRWSLFLGKEGDEVQRLIRRLEKYESDLPEANAFVASCRDSSIPLERKTKLFDDYERTTGGLNKVRAALIRLGDPALPIICTEFRKMYLRGVRGDGYGEEEEDYGYSGEWWNQLELASVMSRSGNLRTLPFFVEALLLNVGELSSDNSWAVGMAKYLRQYRVSFRVVDECMEKIIGISSTYLLTEKRREGS